MPNEVTPWTPGQPLVRDEDFEAAGRELELSQPEPQPDLVPDVADDVTADLARTVETVRRELSRETAESLLTKRELEAVPENLRKVPVEIIEAFDPKQDLPMISAALEAIDESLVEAGLDRMPTAIRNVALEAIADLNDAAGEAMEERDAADKKAGLAQLQRMHRNEYKSLLIDAGNALDRAVPEPLRYILENARDANGTLALNNPVIVKHLSELWRARRDLSPNSPRQRETSPSRRAEIEAIMRADRARYMRDEQMQAEYRRLLSEE